MIEFEEAIQTAHLSMKKFVQSASNIELESAIISADEQFYEITFSYDKGSVLPIMEELQSRPNGLKALATVLSKRRDFKTFLVDSRSGAFRGFKNYKEI